MTWKALGEFACDACPAKCRMEVTYPVNTGPGGGPTYCVGGHVPSRWVRLSYVPSPGGLDITDDYRPVSPDAVGIKGRALLVCAGCSAPCLLELEGLEKIRCPIHVSPTSDGMRSVYREGGVHTR